jgi:hypothetical protein|nr:MAG TPA: hypothetical protein [Caudoviricetes sp.]
MNQSPKYLVYVTQQGVTVLVSYDDIQSLMKGQDIRVGNSDERYYLTIITFKNGVQEQQAVSESQWRFWEEENR